MKGEKVYKITQKISSVAIVCFIISLILEGVNDIFKWSSLISCIGVYSGSLLKEKQKNEKISIPSGILCFGVIVWVVIRSFYPNIYVNILGQCIVYGFLANTGKVMTGKFNKALLITILASLLLNWIHLILDIDWLLLGIAILQIIVFLQFLDPILERIALDHREKKNITKQI